MGYLDDVKTAIGETSTYHDGTLKIYIDEVVDFIKEAGVKESNITSGLVVRGVSDLWNYGAGNGTLSSYFLERVSQLSFKG
jgi:hypothetical protein